MPKASPEQVVFEGELSPLAQARTDLERYPRSMRYMRNMVPCRTGPAIGRSGTYFEQRAAFHADAAKKSVLIPFIFSEDETLQIEASHQKLRFHYEYNGVAANREMDATSIVTTSPLKIKFPGHDWAAGEYVILSGFAGSRGLNNAIGRISALSGSGNEDVTFGDGDLIVSGATGALSASEKGAAVYEVTTVYDGADVQNLRAVQSLNTVYLFCTKTDGSGDYPPYVLKRYDTYDWRISKFKLKDGPYLDVNVTNTTLAPTGNGTWVPTMTGATAPSGSASASSESSGHEAWKAFDGDIDSYWEGKTSQEGWLAFAFAPGFTNSLPDFTSGTSGGMTITAQSTDGSNSAWKAADRDAETDWRCATSLSSGSQYWMIDLGAAQTVREYQIKASATKEEFAPRDFTLQGSNTAGSGYVVIDTRTSLTWDSGQSRQFTVASPGSYRYYRIVTTAVNRKNITVVTPASGKKGKKGYVPKTTTTTKTDNRVGFAEVKMSYTAGVPRVVDGYTIYLGRYAKGKEIKAHAPKTWYFEGYDGVAWNILDSQQNYTDWTQYRSDFFPIQNDEAFETYRIRIKEVNKEGDVTPRIGKLTMSSPDAPDITLRASSKTGINDDRGFLATDVGRQIRLQDADNMWRWAVISAVASEVQVTIDVVSDDPLVLNKKVRFWRLGLWSDTTGWPVCGVLHEDRLWCAGPMLFPDHVVGSRTGRYEIFQQTTRNGVVVDDHAVVLRCNSKYMSRIVWLKSSEEALMVGTGMEEFILTTPVDEALTARNAKIRPTTSRGSIPHEPGIVGNHALMISKSGRALYDYSWQPGNEGVAGAYSNTLLSVLGAHLMQPRVVQVVYQEEPHGILWGRREDGSAVAMTYIPEQQIYGGHRHDFGVTDGEAPVVEWMSVSPSPTDRQDSLWLIIKRKINGAYVRNIERMYRFWDYGDVLTEDATFVDSALRYYESAPISVLYGLRHLEGETLTVLADDIAYHNVGPVVDGALTLTEEATYVVAGKMLTREGEIVAAMSGSQDGTARGKQKRPHRAVISLWESAGGEVGRINEDTNLPEYTPIVYRFLADTPLEITLSTLETDVTVLPPGYGTLGSVRFRNSDPVPFNVVAVYPQLDTTDDA